MSLVFPTPAEAALQAPVNTFSPTSTPLSNTANINTYTYIPAKGVWTITSTGAVTSIAVSSPLISSGGQTPTISIGSASTGSPGAVQLNDSTSSASTTQAATANAVRQAAILATSAIPCSAILAKGSILTGTAPNTPTALAVGTNGQFLVACSTAPEGICWLTLSSCSGTVTSVATGTGLTGGPITASGTIALANTAITPGSYTLGSFTVDAQGRLTAASNGAAVTSVTAGTGLTGGTITSTGTIDLANTAVTAGSYTNSNITVDAQGRITAASSGSAPSGGTVTSVTAGTGLTGGTITSTGTINLADTAVTAGSYTNGSFTVDAQGRLTAASSGTASVTSVSGTAPIVSSGGATPAISLADTAVTSGSYTYASFTVDAKGRLTAASSGTAPSTTVTAPITNGGTAVAPVIGIQAASTTQSGAVQLNDTVTSTSIVEALTAAQGKNLQDQINALAITSNLTLAGTFDATTSQMLSVTSAGTDAGFTVGADLPGADGGITNYFVIVTTGGSYTPADAGGPILSFTNLVNGDQYAVGFYPSEPLVGGSGTGATADITVDASGGVISCILVDAGTGYLVSDSLTALTTPGIPWSIDVLTVGPSTPIVTSQGDWFLCNGTSWEFLNVGPDLPSASTTVAGAVELATNAETQTGTDSTLAVTPASLQSKVSNSVSTTSSSTIASSTAVKTAYDLAAAAVPCSAFTAKGGVLAGTGAGTYEELALSATDGEVLTVDSACTNGVKWAAAMTATPTCEGAVYGCTTLTSGTRTTALGECAGVSLSTGLSNVLLGTSAGCCVTTGGGNNLIGDQAGRGLTTGSSNVFIGSLAGYTVVSGCRNVAIGAALSLPIPDGSCQLALGWKPSGSTMCYWLTGDNTKAIKPGAGIIDCAGSCGTAGQVLVSTGANAVCWSIPSVATPSCLGTVKGCITAFVTALGCNALCSQTTGNNNTALGAGAGNNITTGSCNVLIGPVTAPSATGSCNLAIGYSDAGLWLTGDNTKAIKPGAGIIDCAGCCGTAGQVLSSTGANAVEWSNGPNAGCAMTRNANGQNLTSLASYTPLLLRYCTAVTDSTSWYNSTTGVFTPTVEGWYQVTAGARVFAGACENVLSLLCNATVISTVGGYNLINATVSALAYMNGTTDAMCVQIRNATGGCTMGQSTSSNFSAVLVALP